MGFCRGCIGPAWRQERPEWGRTQGNLEPGIRESVTVPSQIGISADGGKVWLRSWAGGKQSRPSATCGRDKGCLRRQKFTCKYYYLKWLLRVCL